ncbi:MAG: UDP-3-O-(3-hydroxymyristoyl)glucosamine N-acyltransferase [Rhodocyclaceae bacterium]|nr:UDP-3-O-(3-hydroxymyristoyl)glucosamine N-acyltransferase [Rhodocyclaceae bacterium]MCP5239006.1 UDP-3-O-(3-hydroxymyristoyl)glucosamine N-acyltransferase [Zoogloeaceae bacterium]MCB1911552.1 UDP-3-O-(3-hydroxymyristoyl)glucosamine N-acyltransferase [Rhodocyclaceae bacterium]MCP5254106.1 UDP-3-O-(3-hydroxymyristoyl)glucosamine N-acyltransferase [Zoogloeaceae bacterium]MCP5295281.1 UDP-3-O-(3-hydroxymyristoyl)glucosamine N-acyltransferase [Zoogloeaceae bacterium]
MPGEAREFHLSEIVAKLGGSLQGEIDPPIRRIATLERAGEGELAFFSNPRYRAQLVGCAASALILSPQAAVLWKGPAILCDDPYLYFAQVATLFSPPALPCPGIHPSAMVECSVPDSVEVAAGAWIGPNVTIGPDSIIGAGCRIGEGVQIGAGARLMPGATIYPGCVIGERVIVHSGAVIGSDGFGFARRTDASWYKIPQTGRVVIGDDVEIGANTTIDRGALDDTIIADGVKLDNQIQIGHNVRVGAHTAIAGCVGIAGSTRIGERCMIGGQAGIIGHLEIANDVIVSAGTLVTKSIAKKGVYTGNLPVQGHAEWVKNFAHLRHLDAMADKIRALEHRLAGLEKS